MLEAIELWTGDRPLTCPRRALSDPLVMRVMHAYQAFKRGAFASAEPDPSHRLMEGVLHFDRMLKTVEYEQFKEEQANAAKRRKER